jgi:hypothetical protein
MESLDYWTKVASGTGALSAGATYHQITSGLTSGGIYRLSKQPVLPPFKADWAKARTIEFYAETLMDTDAASENYICTGSGLPTADGFGFIFTDSKIQGFACNGAPPTLADLITALTPAATYDHLYKAVFTPGVSVKFYIDGVLTGTITTDLPVTNTNPHIPCKFAVKSGANAASIIRTSGFAFQQDL